MSSATGCQLQVSLKGGQDVALFHPNEDTLFRQVVRRITNFASGEAEQSTNTTAALGRRNIQTTITRAGDLLSQVYLHAEFDPIVPATGGTGVTGWSTNTYTSYCNGLGYAMIDEIRCILGSKDVDTQDGEFMFMREQSASKPHKRLGQAVGFYANQDDAAVASLVAQELNVPLQFWFCNYLEQSLPTIGLYWHDLQFNLSLRTQAQLIFVKGGGSTYGDTVGGLTDLHYICNFQYLDRAERALFANEKMEQIFIQHQTLGDETWAAADTFHNCNIRFNHPVTDIMFAPRLDSNTALNDWFNFHGTSFNPYASGATQTAETFVSAQMKFNNNDRTITLSSKYLRQLPFHRAQSRIPEEDFPIYGYCFGADVNDVNHSGSANFSRYDKAEWRVNLWGAVAQPWSGGTTLGANTTVRMHARNFQLSKFALGMMGVKFAS